MTYDINITFNDGKDNLHAKLTPNEFVELQTNIRTNETFVSVKDTDGIIRMFQPETIKEMKTIEPK